MSITQAIISGVLQGITEFLPISSSGHLVILHKFFGINQPQVTLDVFLHTGTLFAVLIYFRNDIKDILSGNRRLGLLVLLGCVPIFVAGFLFTGVIESAFANVKIVGICLLVTGAWLFLGHLASTKSTLHASRFTLHEMRLPQVLIIGCAQAVALLPGISRGGATISTGLMCGLDRQSAFRYSFLLFVPATLGALGFKLLEATGVSSLNVLPALTGTIAAFLIGLISLKALQAVLLKGKLYLFGIYCFLLAGVLLT